MTIKTRTLMGASTLVLGAAAAGAASAQTTPIQAYGGGSSLIAPYIRIAGDCYGNPTPLLVKGTPATSVSEPAFNFMGTPAQNCATQHTDTTFTLNYISTGSGSGIKALYQHNPQDYGSITQNTTDPATYYPTVNFGISETSLGEADVAVYNNGGTTAGGQTVNVVAPGATPGAGQYPNPATTYGALVQFPVLVTPVTIAYSPVYKKVVDANGNVTSYSFHFKSGVARADGSGGLRLDQATYCKIFNGTIKDWNAPEIAALNQTYTTVKGVKVYNSIKDPNDPTPAASWSVPMQIVGRSDSSGTSALWTRHLAAVCGAITAGPNETYTNYYADATTTMPAALQGATVASGNAAPQGETLGKYTLANGSGGVATYIAYSSTPANGSSSTQGRIGYLGPDYTNPTTNLYGLSTASLLNLTGTGWIAPTGAAAANAFGTTPPPESDASGNYVAATSSSAPHRNDPAAWVQAASKTALLATPTKAGAYPIVGTSNFIGYTCYAGYATQQQTVGKTTTTVGSGLDVGTKVNNFLTWYITKTIVESNAAGAKGILPSEGFAPLPVAWKTAIKDTFLRPTSSTNTLPLNLWISPQGAIYETSTATGRQILTVPENPSCSSVAGG